MKQGLFANCYSTIHGLNLIKHVNTHTHILSIAVNVRRKFKTSTLFYLVTLREEDHSRKSRDLFGLLDLS